MINMLKAEEEKITVDTYILHIASSVIKEEAIFCGRISFGL